ncbi:MAG: tetratricopeptide repeat protein, partial [candidate division Zixibacteria bacterium]
ATEAEQLAIMQMKANSEDKTGEARSHLERLVTLLPESRRAHYLMGIFYFGQQEWPGAENEFTIITSLDPDFAPVYNMLGYAYSNQMKYAEAIDALKHYASLRPDDPNPYDSMGEIYLHSGAFENSIMAYESSLKLDPRFNASHAGLGHNYCFTKDFEKAREQYNMFRSGAKSVADTNIYYFWTAVAFVHEDKMDDAISILREQFDFAGERGMVGTQGACCQQLALVYLERGDYKKALAEAKIEHDLAKDPKLQKAAVENMVRNANAIEARVYSLQGKNDEAKKHLEKFRISAESSGNEINIDNYHGLAGLVAFSMDNHTEAVEHFSLANEQNMYQQYYHAMALEGAGKTDEARELFEKVVHYNRNNFVYAFVRDAAKGRM